jgi:hypothetical protein
VSASGVPLAVARAFAQEDHLKLAETLSLLDENGFPGGKPPNRYEYVMPIMSWLLPAGLPIGAVLMLAGAVGFCRQRQRSAA